MEKLILKNERVLMFRPNSTIMAAGPIFRGGVFGSTFAVHNLSGNGHFILGRV